MSHIEFDLSEQSTAYSAGEFMARSSAALQLPPPVQLQSNLSLQPNVQLTPPPSPQVQETPGVFKIAPLLNRASSVISRRASPSPSPTREQPEHTTSTARRRKQSKAAAFTDLFHGSSELVSSFNLPSKRQQVSKSPTRPVHSRANSSFSKQYMSKASLSQSPRSDHVEEEEEDEILNLDLESELFPDGLRQKQSPAAFDELLSNAERLFMRMEMAYQQKFCALQTAKAARKIEKEELEEARVRADHLKLQLDDMSAKVAEREDAMNTLAEELATERRQRGLRERSVRLVHANENIIFETAENDSSEETSSESAGFWSRPVTPSSISTQPDAEPTEQASPGRGGLFDGRSQVSMLRDENRRLKERVAELEETVEGCLGLVGAL